MDEYAKKLIERCAQKLQTLLNSAIQQKEKIEEYVILLEKNESILNDTLHLIYVERNPADFGARKHDAREAQRKMSDRLKLLNELITSYQLFLEEVSKNNFTMVLHAALKELSNRLYLTKDADPFWQITQTMGVPSARMISILGSHSASLEKAAACVKTLANEDPK